MAIRRDRAAGMFAALMIALMAADTLQETDQRVRRTCNAEARDEGVNNFQSTLGAFLLSEKSVKNLLSLRIYGEDRAAIQYHGEIEGPHFVDFDINKSRGRRPVISIVS
jgi:hypothetical protein